MGIIAQSSVPYQTQTKAKSTLLISAVLKSEKQILGYETFRDRSITFYTYNVMDRSWTTLPCPLRHIHGVFSCNINKCAEVDNIPYWVFLDPRKYGDECCIQTYDFHKAVSRLPQFLPSLILLLMAIFLLCSIYMIRDSAFCCSPTSLTTNSS